MNLEEEEVPISNARFPILPTEDVERVVQTILHLFSPETSSNPGLAKHLQHELQVIQSSPEAWGLITGLAGHNDANVRFFSAHTAQVKISRDWDTLPAELQPSILALLLEILGGAISPLNPLSYQPANSVVVRKLFGSLASLLIRLPFPLFPHPILTVLQTISSSSTPSPYPSQPPSGYATPTGFAQPPFGSLGAGVAVGMEESKVRLRTRLWGLEWCGMCVEEIGRAALSEQKRLALRKHIESDLPAVMSTVSESMSSTENNLDQRLKEAEAACKCAESWIQYGLGGDELTCLLPPLYNLLPLPAACSALVEALSESIFKFGKGTKILTEPLIAWTVGPPGQSLISTDGDVTEEIEAVTKLICALVEHSSEWLVARLGQNDVQAFLGVVLRLTGWTGIGGVEESVSQLTLPIYPIIQEAVMDSDIYSSDHETHPNWLIAKHFFRELVDITRRKVRWAGDGDSPDGSLGGLDKEDREVFESWRRDAGEVIVGAYYILRDEMLASLVQLVSQAVESNAPWQDIEACLHCIRYSAEAVPLGEDKTLPTLFGDTILGRLSQRPSQGKGEGRLRLTVVCLIQAYEEWFKFHPDHLLPVLAYLVPSLTSTPTISRSAADSLKALCDICRGKLVQHIGAFSELHGKIGDLGPEEQTKVIEAITSVIQALTPPDAIDPVEGIILPIIDRLNHAITLSQADPTTSQPILVQSMEALTACFKGLSPSDDDMFDLIDEANEEEIRLESVKAARLDARMVEVRRRIEESISGVVGVWNGDSEVADSISSLLKHSTLASSETLISLSPLPLLTLVCTACERSPSALWMSLASTLVLRINSPPSGIFRKKTKTPAEEQVIRQGDEEKWTVIGDAAGRLVVIAGNTLGQPGAIAEHPDVAEAWFKFSSALSTRFPGILVRLPTNVIEGYMSLGLMGLSAQERFSLKTATEFFTAFLSGTRYPSPLEPLSEPLINHFAPQILRSLILSAGNEGPRSVIPNLAELLAGLVIRVSGTDMASWLEAILSEEGFPDPRATYEAKKKFKDAVLRGRTSKKMREALHDFALVARGLDGTTYGNATAI